MGRFWITVIMLTLSGCYEGWENYRSGTETGNETPVPQPPGPKSIYYVLYQPITMTEAAAKDTRCLPVQAISEYKINEWSLRTSGTSAMLVAIAEKVVVAPINISASDCQNLTAVAVAADSLAPWGSEDPPEQDPLDRISIHLKAPMWEEEPTSDPSSRVKRTNWAGWQKLGNEGRRVASAHHFVISNATNGYFGDWQAALPPEDLLAGTTIDSPDPSEAGIGARAAIIDADTEALKRFLLTYVTR